MATSRQLARFAPHGLWGDADFGVGRSVSGINSDSRMHVDSFTFRPRSLETGEMPGT